MATQEVSVGKTTSRKGLFEQGPGLYSGLADFPSKVNSHTMTAGILATIFGCTGPALIIMNSAMAGKLTEAQTISWLFSVYFFGGLLGIIHALYYKMPINGAWSIPGAVMLATSLTFFNLSQAAGAYLLAGVIVLVLGVTGLIDKVMRWIPLPIVMGMIAGAMIRFGTGIVSSVQQLPLVCGIAMAGYLLVQRVSKRIPPILATLVVGLGAAYAFGAFNLKNVHISWVAPQFVPLQFSMDAFLSIAVPLAVLVIGAENAQAIGVLMAQGYNPPINTMTILSGIGGIVTAFFGGHNANIAGPMTAICSSEEAGPDKTGRYAATIINGLTFGSFGLFASAAVPFVKAIPSALISLLAGLAMIGVLLSAFEGAFAARKFRAGAFFALVIAMSGITLFKISSPFWALVGGVIVSLVMESGDFGR
ncbi:MAG: benzoate/H(+) symporter BenE family transporter [Firmicutes bacterium]|jgi:benzoate membrane transport protein|nr:benzoate/H(+) symporter BenE family transporter [Bacillota bacterium]